MTRRMILLAILAAMMTIVAACTETEPELVDDEDEDTTEEVDSAESDESEDADEEDQTEEDAEADDAGEEEGADEEGTEEQESSSDSETDAAADEGEADETDEDTSQETDTGDGAEEPSDEGADDGLESEEGFAVGDSVRMGDLVMHLHAVRWGEGDEFMAPEEGMRWLIADIEIENEADSATSISSLMMFDLVDQENRSRDMAFMADTQGSLDGELGAGRAMRGDLAWEVPADQTQWELIFSPELFGFGQAIYDISEGDF